MTLAKWPTTRRPRSGGDNRPKKSVTPMQLHVSALPCHATREEPTHVFYVGPYTMHVCSDEGPLAACVWLAQEYPLQEGQRWVFCMFKGNTAGWPCQWRPLTHQHFMFEIFEIRQEVEEYVFVKEA